MRYLAEIPGSTATVELDVSNPFLAPKLLANDVPARPGLKRGEFLVPGDNGEEIVVRLKPQFIDPVPALEVNGQTIRVAPAFTWEWIFVGLPFLLVLGGGCIGGLIGGVASWGNATILRSELPMGAKAAIAALVSAVTLGGGFALLTVLQLSVRSATGR